MNREYLRVSHTTAKLDPEAVTNALGSLHKLTSIDSKGRLNPLGSPDSVTFEFVALSEGRDEPVEFYYGADDRLGVLEQRLPSIYPSSFDVDRVEVDLLGKLLPSDGTRKSVEDLAPRGVRWRGSVDRRQDWMTTLSNFSDAWNGESSPVDEDAHRSGRAPLAPLVDQLTRSSHPLAFQVVFQRKSDWSKRARRRSGALLSGKDTLTQRVPSLESPGPDRRVPREVDGGRQRRARNTVTDPPSRSPAMRDRERDQRNVTRLDLLRENDPKRTFSVNARLLAFPTDTDGYSDLDDTLDNLSAIFDTLDGPYYEIEGERLRDSGLLSMTDGRGAHNVLERFRNRSLQTRRRDRLPRLTNRADSRPDLVLNADELANLVVVPSASSLTVEGSRGTRSEQRSRNPLPRPDHDITSQLRQPGLELGHLLDENREPEDEPIRLSPDLLPFHVGRFAKTGAGKSIALINDALSLAEQTSGPVFLIDTKGGGLPEHYMRAHAKRFGFEDLEERVLHFDIPDILPGFAFFNIEPALASGVPRLQAIKDRVDHY